LRNKGIKDIRKTRLKQSDEGTTPLNLPKWGDLQGQQNDIKIKV